MQTLQSADRFELVVPKKEVDRRVRLDRLRPEQVCPGLYAVNIVFTWAAVQNVKVRLCKRCLDDYRDLTSDSEGG